MPPMRKTRGFTLIEMAIVLAIVALLAGGVLVGQSMIRAAELNSVSADLNKFVTATTTFRDRYFGLPGDLANATSYWGTSSTGCNSNANLTQPGTCNGNGNGKVTWCSDTTASDYSCKEPFWYWQQLGLAGLTESSYTGSGLYSPTEAVAGYNAPPSRISSAGFWMVNNADYTSIGTNYWYSIDYGNYLLLPQNVLKPEEAWNIDTKLDDGMPGTGKVVAIDGSDVSNPHFGAGTCTTSANSSDFSGQYRLKTYDKICTLAFIKAF